MCIRLITRGRIDMPRHQQKEKIQQGRMHMQEDELPQNVLRMFLNWEDVHVLM